MSDRQPMYLSELLRDLPMTSRRYRVLLLVSVVMIFEGYDTMIIPYVMPKLGPLWHLTPVENGFLASYGFIGLLVGAIVLGPIADRFGRRSVMIVGLLWFSVFTGLTMFATGYGSFACFRVLGGLGLGGVMPISASIAAEYAPPQRRGLWVSSVYAGFILGWVLSALLAMFIVPHFGWRGMFFVGLIPVLYAVILAKWLPESLQILLKWDQPDRVRRSLAQLGYAQFSEDRYQFVLDTIEEKHSLAEIGLLFRDRMGVTTVLLWFATFFTLLFMYGYATWLPTLMVKHGHGLVRSYSYSLVVDVAQVLGNLLLGLLMDRFGAKRVTVTYFILLAISVILFGLNSSNVYIYLLSIFVGLFTAVQAGINTILAQVYPTNVRASGIGWNAGIGRLGSIFGPVVVGAFAPLNMSLEGYMLLFGVMALLAMLAVLLTRIRHSVSTAMQTSQASSRDMFPS
ncbi:MAG: MFS transporter [Alicyclobacillus sp.]|nr:MFS transporter [Alicyclobacillus sp.]